MNNIPFTTDFDSRQLLNSNTANADSFTEQYDPPNQVIVNLKALATNLLQPLRDRVGEAVFITSGYRCERVNTAVGGVSNSQHLTGEAADTHVNSMSIEDWYQYVKNAGIPFDQCIQEFGQWCHVSFNATPGAVQRGECWRYVKGEAPRADGLGAFKK